MSEEGVRIPLNFTDIPCHKLFASKPPESIFHYTDFNGMSGIVESKSLWLTKLSYLNDKSELKYAIDRFKFTAEIRASKINNSEKKEFLESTSKNLNNLENTNICVASFCEDGDLLSQWRSYGNDGSGVAIEFNANALNKLSNTGLMNLWKCVYSEQDQHLIVDGLVDILLNSFDVVYKSKEINENWEATKKDIQGYFNTTFLRVAPVIKNSHFREEKEWRLITVSRPFTDENWYARVSNQRVSEYYKLNFDLIDAANYYFIQGVTVGPTNEPWMKADAIGVLLRKNGFKHKHMHVSQIPYRS